MSFTNTPMGRAKRFWPIGVVGHRQRLARGINCGSAATIRVSSHPPDLSRVINVKRLLGVFHDRKRWAGSSVGTDGLTWSDYGRSEIAEALRAASCAIESGTYIPMPKRPVDIPRNNRSPRRLDIGTIVDRTMAASLAECMAPFLESIFSPTSFAYRTNRSPQLLLAHLAVTAHFEDRWFLGNHDISNAFPRISLDGVMDAHRNHIRNEALLRFIECVVRGSEGAQKRIGLSQGCPYSPQAMNLYMHEVLDRLTAPDASSLTRFRFCDDLIALDSTVAEAQCTRAQYEQLLGAVGLQLKDQDEPDIIDLRGGQSVRVLGFEIAHRGGEMTFGIGPESWRKLRSNLLECHECDNPPKAAIQVIEGWVGALGPAFEASARCLPEIIDLSREFGFVELRCDRIESAWATSWNSWRTMLNTVREEYARRHGS